MATCSQCGSSDLEWLDGPYSTGVVSPDGYAEQWYERGYRCRECGAFLEIT